MSGGACALQLVLGGDPALYSVVALSLYVSRRAVACGAARSTKQGGFMEIGRKRRCRNGLS